MLLVGVEKRREEGIGGVLQLGIDEFVADDVGQDEDGGVGLLVLGVGDVGADCVGPSIDCVVMKNG